MTISTLRKPNRTPDNKLIVPEARKPVTSQEGSIEGVLDTGTSVLCLDERGTARHWPAMQGYAMLLGPCMI